MHAAADFSPLDNIPAITPCTQQQVSLPLVVVQDQLLVSLQNSKMESEAHLSLKKTSLWIPTKTFLKPLVVLFKPNKMTILQIEILEQF